MRTRNQLLILFFLIAILASASASMILFYPNHSIPASENPKSIINSEVKEMSLQGLGSETFVAGTTPISSEMSFEIHGLRNFLLFFNLAVIILALFATYYAEKSFTRPLKELRVATAQISEGIFNTRFDKNYNKEINELAESFNKMTDVLNKKFKNIEKVGFIVSHDLRGPLNNIIPLVNYIKEDNKNLSTESVQMLNMIESKAIQMNELISEILNTTKSDIRIKESIETSSLVNRIVSNLELSSSIQISIDPNLPLIHFYKTPIIKLFNEVLTTIAGSFTNDGGKIDITYTKEKSAYKFCISYQVNIVREEVKNISLYSCKKLVSDFDGQIWLEPVNSHQNHVVFTIPIV